MQEIKITIEPDGTVKTEVRGVKGTSCKDLTRAIETALGGTAKSTLTGEFYLKGGTEQVKVGGR